jgi:GNAT superfamily N-acetyltransferase
MSPIVRTARPGDEPAILALIHHLALYEREPDAVRATVDSLRATFFGRDPRVFAHVAEQDDRIVGIAIWFRNYSTWTGKPGLYLEDLVVQEEARGLGVGRALFEELARVAKAQGCARIDWAVLDWNEAAMDFYRRIGGRAQLGWQPWRLDGDALETLAQPAQSQAGI